MRGNQWQAILACSALAVAFDACKKDKKTDSSCASDDTSGDCAATDNVPVSSGQPDSTSGGGTVTPTAVTPTPTPSPASTGANDLAVKTVTPASLFIGVDTTITITGTGFASGDTVKIGDQDCTDVTLDSPTQLHCHLTPTTAGATQVTITDDSGKSTTPTVAATVANYTPTSVTATASRMLATIDLQLNSSQLLASSTPMSADLGGLSPSSLATNATAADAAKKDASTDLTVSVTATPSSAAAQVDSLNTAFTATLSVSALFPSGATAACRVEAPYTALSCDPTAGVTVHSTDIVGGGLVVAGFPANGPATESQNAAAVATTKFTIRQLTNWGSMPLDMKVLDGRLYMVGYGLGTSGEVLLVYDGTQIRHSDINGGHDGPAEFTLYHHKIYFDSEVDMSGSKKLFAYDPANAQHPLAQVADIAAGGDDQPQALTAAGEKLYFVADVSGNGAYLMKLFAYDDTSTPSVKKVVDFMGSSSDAPSYLTAFNNKLYLSIVDASGYSGFYRYDPTDTDKLYQLSNDNINGDAPHGLATIGNSLYVVKTDDSNFAPAQKIYAIDQQDHIRQLTDLHHQADDVVADPFFTTIGGGIYFVGVDGSSNRKIFRYDTAGQIVEQVSDVAAGNSDIGTYEDPQIINAGGKAVMFLSDGNNNYYLCVHDPAAHTFTRYTNLTAASGMGHAIGYNGKAFFVMNPNGHYKLYVYDPSTNQVGELSLEADETDDDFYSPYQLQSMAVYNNVLYFNANQPGTSNGELFSLCDSNAGC